MNLNRDKCVSCKITRYQSKNVRFFRFPKNEEICKQWVLACRLKWMVNVPAQTLYKRVRLCSKHFKDDDYVSPKMNRLKPSACPSKFEFFEKNIIPKLKEDLKNKLSKSINVNDGQFCGEVHSESEKLSDGPQILTTRMKEKSTFVETGGEILNGKENKLPDSSDSELLNTETDSIKIEVNEAVLLDISMNESFYSPEYRKILTSNFSESSESHSKVNNTPVQNISLQELKAKSSMKAIKKQWLEAEIKAATAKRDYYENKILMLSKLQEDLDYGNSPDSQISAAILYIENYLNKEELAYKNEKMVLKQQLQGTNTVANNCEIDFCEPKLEICLDET